MYIRTYVGAYIRHICIRRYIYRFTPALQDAVVNLCSTLKHNCHTCLTLPLPWSASVPAHFSAVEAIPVALDKTVDLPYSYECIYMICKVFAVGEYSQQGITYRYVHEHAVHAHTYTYTDTHTCMCTHTGKKREANTYQQICKYTYMYVHMYIHTVHTCTYSVCCLHVHMYVHTYICTHLDISTALIFLSYSSSIPLNTFFSRQISAISYAHTCTYALVLCIYIHSPYKYTHMDICMCVLT